VERSAAHNHHDGGVAHGKHDHAHNHGVSADADRRWLAFALALIATFMVAEVIVGVIAGSLALITDAGHMLTDAASIVLALIAIRLAARPAKGSYTYGLKRAEISRRRPMESPCCCWPATSSSKAFAA
jgi:cobalt-zinc-cadmium efflux system protein